MPSQVRWLGSDSALVVTDTWRQIEQVTLVYACGASTQRCQEVYDAGSSRVQIGR